MSEVHIEESKGVKFAPFNGGYPEHAEHLKAANLNPANNLWYDIYDHSDSAKTRENWSLLSESEYEEPWFPVGPCEPAIPRSKSGCVATPATTQVGESFSLQDMIADSEKQKVASAATKSMPAAASAPIDPPAIPKLPASEQVIAPSRGIESLPDPNPVSAPAPSSPVKIQPITAEDSITQLLKSFCAYKVGEDLSALVDSEHFSQIGPTGKSICAADLEACAPLSPGRFWSMGAQGVKVSSSSDIAHVSYYAWVVDAGAKADAPPTVCAFTALLSHSIVGWRLTQVQGSSPISIEDLPPPMTLF